MPIPTPNEGETRSSFMIRCVSQQTGEGIDQDQAIAICSQAWDDKKEIDYVKDMKIKSIGRNDIIQK